MQPVYRRMAGVVPCALARLRATVHALPWAHTTTQHLMRILRLVAATALMTLIPVQPSWAQIRQQTVQFAKGASSATVKARIKGGQTVDYVVRAKAGQTMTVSLVTSNPSNYFNVLPPGSNDVALFVSSDGSSNRWSGALSADGAYKIRVYLMRNAARRGESANYTLSVGVTGAAAAAAASGGSRASNATARARAGKFDATGQLPCAQAAGQPMAQCHFGVARAGGGTATVNVTLPDGRKRMIFFEDGRAVGTDASQADGNTKLQSSKEADLFILRSGNERFEVVEAVVFGG
jgi:hypothetical protein